jgi:hypothetical protein
MNRFVLYAFTAASFLILNSCLKKAPSYKISGKLYSKHGVAMKNTNITFTPNAQQLDEYQKKMVITTLSDGSFNYLAQFTSKDTKISMECVSDSGTVKRTGLSRKDVEALPHEFVLE